jgi:hypothetical protein
MTARPRRTTRGSSGGRTGAGVILLFFDLLTAAQRPRIKGNRVDFFVTGA